MTTPIPEAESQTRATPDLPGQLVGWLRSLVSREKPDRAALAALRRGAGEKPGSVPGMFALVEPNLPDNVGEGRLRDDEADSAYRVAALFALHHQGANQTHDWLARKDGRWEERNLGASLRMAARGDDGSLDSGIERRFLALLDARSEDLDPHLRSLFTLMKARKDGTPVDYYRLYSDLLNWGRPDRRVQRRWAAGFWRATAGTAQTPAESTPESNGDTAATNGDD